MKGQRGRRQSRGVFFAILSRGELSTATLKNFENSSALAYPEAYLDLPGGPKLRQRPAQIVLYSSILGVSVAVSLATGLVSWAHVVYPQPEVWGYGLPFAWRRVIFGGSPVSPTAVPDWSWLTFALDVLFYMAAGYLVVTVFQRRHRIRAIYSSGVALSITYVVSVLLVSIGFYLMYCGMRQCA